jgi:hypothetical protein
MSGKKSRHICTIGSVLIVAKIAAELSTDFVTETGARLQVVDRSDLYFNRMMRAPARRCTSHESFSIVEQSASFSGYDDVLVPVVKTCHLSAAPSPHKSSLRFCAPTIIFPARFLAPLLVSPPKRRRSAAPISDTDLHIRSAARNFSAGIFQ